MKKLIALITAILMIVCLSACSGNNGDTATDDTASKVEEKTVEIKTKYAVIEIPESCNKDVKNTVESEDPYTVTFTTKDGDRKLLSIVFGEEKGSLLGTLITETENIFVYADAPVLDEKSETYEQDFENQDKILNTIISNLIADNDFAVNELIDREDNSTFEITNDVVTLQYPEKWKGKIKIDVSGNVIAFSYLDAKLFDVCFEECDGRLMGYYKETPVYIIAYDIDDKEMTDEESGNAYAMQDDLNVIIENLKKDSSFTAATNK